MLEGSLNSPSLFGFGTSGVLVEHLDSVQKFLVPHLGFPWQFKLFGRLLSCPGCNFFILKFWLRAHKHRACTRVFIRFSGLLLGLHAIFDLSNRLVLGNEYFQNALVIDLDFVLRIVDEPLLVDFLEVVLER